MFNKKQESLIAATKTSSSNAFVAQSLKRAATTTDLGNGAIKLTTTGNDFVDDFGKISQYRAPRSFAEIATDMFRLWSQNALMAMQLLFYIRLITRKVQFADGQTTETTQRGQGLKHEAIFRMMWVAINYPQVFWNNINLFIAVGSWKDIFVMLSYDLQYNGWNNRKLDWALFGDVLMAGLENPNTVNLVKKYLPQIKANNKCRTLEAQADNIIAKWICALLFGTKEGKEGSSYKKYRQLKASGTAHEWQQLISQHKMLEIDFSSIHGRALAQLVSSKFLANQGLTKKYEQWIESQPVAKFTGYVHELFAPLTTTYHAPSVNLPAYKLQTIDKQFAQLIEVAKQGMNQNSSFIVTVDSSGSMDGLFPGTKISAYTVAKSMALYFSYLLKGVFSGTFLEFSDKTVMKQWKGATPSANFINETSRINGSTNFRSVGQHFVKMLRQGVPEKDFPTGLLCVSDGCFNNSGQNINETAVLLNDLLNGGFSREFVDNFRIVLWDIPNNAYGRPQTAFESFANAPNLFHMSGLDPAAIAFLMGKEGKEAAIPKNSEELFEAAMNQEVLNMISI